MIISLIVGYVLDLCLGDPEKIPHPVVYFGRIIEAGDRSFNRNTYLLLKGGVFAFALVGGSFMLFWGLETIARCGGAAVYTMFAIIFIFFGLANRTLLKEGEAVKEFIVKRDIGGARRQLSRIVGRDTASLDDQQIIKAVLETLSENLNDGVVAPLFYFAFGGVAGMMAYKMINTLDSMIGYDNQRYRLFGKCAARLDDVAGYIPARITALMILLAGWAVVRIPFVMKYGKCHASPNSGYPEAALAAVLNCRLGGPSYYHGEYEEKPYIGENDRIVLLSDIEQACRINHLVTVFMVMLCSVLIWVI